MNTIMYYYDDVFILIIYCNTHTCYIGYRTLNLKVKKKLQKAKETSTIDESMILDQQLM